jgi:hypothetical protein
MAGSLTAGLSGFSWTSGNGAIINLLYRNRTDDRGKAPMVPKINATFKGCQFAGWYGDTGSRSQNAFYANKIVAGLPRSLAAQDYGELRD